LIPPDKGTRNRIYVSMGEQAIAGYKCLAFNVSDQLAGAAATAAC
jgi:hypothetical protein